MNWKSTYYLWLNDTTLDRYYWIGSNIQNWTTNFADATKYETKQEALDAAVYAKRTTKAEVVIQEMLEAA